jgi:D-alanyl-lipoteichoic acid acyltransferase DltB (MBOAT superfamily)
MPFNTYTFIAFFIIVLIIHYSLRDWKTQKINLLVVSYIFYSAWNPIFVFLLIISTICDWIVAKRIYRSHTQKSKNSYLILSLVINLGLLGYFKYGAFLLDNTIHLLSTVGIIFQPASFDIILPVGISFYTFQTLSYSLDVYRGKLKPGNSLLDYALYVSFFPQLVAGPIVRAGDFLPQCEKPRRASQDQLGWGLSLLTIGLFMKIILADTLFAPVVDKVYDNPEQFSNIETWTAILSFSGQIFCDFAGYSTCAIGIALCLGFVLPDNFKAPYAALGFRDFWRRWHISLSSWFRDYVYISLGGNRLSVTRTHLNVMITMLIAGLWHGASWMFVLWGGLHGFYLLIENKIRASNHSNVQRSWVTQLALIILTYLIVSVTWILFRAENLNDAAIILSHLYSSSSHPNRMILSIFEINMALLASFVLLAWHIYQRDKSIEHFYNRIHPIFRGVFLFAQLLIIYLFASGDDHAFIYFQF